MAKDTPENRVKASVKQLLEVDGWFVQANPQYGPFCTKGRPDMEAYKDGKCLLIECKSKTGRQSPAQKKYEQEVKRYVPYILARGPEDVEPYLTTVQVLFRERGEQHGNKKNVFK